MKIFSEIAKLRRFPVLIFLSAFLFGSAVWFTYTPWHWMPPPAKNPNSFYYTTMVREDGSIVESKFVDHRLAWRREKISVGTSTTIMETTYNLKGDIIDTLKYKVEANSQPLILSHVTQTDHRAIISETVNYETGVIKRRGERLPSGDFRAVDYRLDGSVSAEQLFGSYGALISQTVYHVDGSSERMRRTGELTASQVSKAGRLISETIIGTQTIRVVDYSSDGITPRFAVTEKPGVLVQEFFRPDGTLNVSKSFRYTGEVEVAQYDEAGNLRYVQRWEPSASYGVGTWDEIVKSRRLERVIFYTDGRADQTVETTVIFSKDSSTASEVRVELTDLRTRQIHVEFWKYRSNGSLESRGYRQEGKDIVLAHYALADAIFYRSKLSAEMLRPLTAEDNAVQAKAPYDSCNDGYVSVCHNN